MKKLRNNVYIYIGFMVAFIAIILLGFIYGDKHPQLFFWGIMIISGSVIALYIAPSHKDWAKLVVQVLVLCTAGSLLNNFVIDPFFSGTRFEFIISFVCLAPFFFPAWNTLLNICIKSKALSDD